MCDGTVSLVCMDAWTLVYLSWYACKRHTLCTFLQASVPFGRRRRIQWLLFFSQNRVFHGGIVTLFFARNFRRLLPPI
ncbi:hypothetical protein BZA77DRAFT_307521 [Pyronema omphalodes]|nr:hypothetical protein BZA77DRAFT_307521 [Pyronema omphalodes]